MAIEKDYPPSNEGSVQNAPRRGRRAKQETLFGHEYRDIKWRFTLDDESLVKTGSLTKSQIRDISRYSRDLVSMPPIDVVDRLITDISEAATQVFFMKFIDLDPSYATDLELQSSYCSKIQQKLHSAALSDLVVREDSQLKDHVATLLAQKLRISMHELATEFKKPGFNLKNFLLDGDKEVHIFKELNSEEKKEEAS